MSLNSPPVTPPLSRRVFHFSILSDDSAHPSQSACQTAYADSQAGMILAIQESIEQAFGESLSEDRSENGGTLYQFRMKL